MRAPRPVGTFVTLLVLLVGVAKPLAAASSPAFSHPPRVVDSAGRVVGTLVDTLFSSGDYSNVIVLRRVSGTAVAFRLSATGYPYSFGSSLIHESSDCSGPRYLLDEPPTVGFRIISTFDVSNVGTGPIESYYQGEPPGQHPVHSCENTATPSSCTADGGTPLASGFCCYAANPSGGCPFSDGHVIQARPAVLLELPAFTPPFSVK